MSPRYEWPERLRINGDGTMGPEHRTITQDSGTILSWAPWLIVDGREIAPVPVYAPQSWWDGLLRRPRRQAGWSTDSFTASAPGGVVTVEMREVSLDQVRPRPVRRAAWRSRIVRVAVAVVTVAGAIGMAIGVAFLAVAPASIGYASLGTPVYAQAAMNAFAVAGWVVALAILTVGIRSAWRTYVKGARR